MALPLHLLRLFTQVAEAASFSRAADRLHISQPAVSKGVRDLERQLGVVLLDRRSDGVQTTEAGAALLTHAREIFASERAAEAELRAMLGLAQGSLGVGASTTIATYHIASPLAAFRARHPGVSLRLVSANTRDVLELLLRRELDVALVEGPVEEPRVAQVPWRREAMALIAAPAHRLARRGGKVGAHDLADELVILREPGSGTREVALAALAALGPVPGQQLEVGSTEAIKQLVAAGLGVAIVSKVAAADQIALGRLVVLPMQGGEVGRMLSRLRLIGRRASPAAMVFEALLDTAGEIGAAGEAG